MKIAILGYGTVGKGLVEIIEGNKNKRNIQIEGILVRNKEKYKSSKYNDIITENIEDIFDKEIDILVELMGGLHPSYEYIKRFPPASVPAIGQEQPQENSYLKVSSAPGQRTDKFRHSPALENTRLWCLVGQTFLRSDIQGRFPVSISPPAYGQRQRTHGE